MTKENISPPPPRPADILSDFFGRYESLNQADLARALAMSRLTANELLNGHRAINAVMALKLARLFGTDAEFWLNLQQAWDLYHARLDYAAEVAVLTPLREWVADDQTVRRISRSDIATEGQKRPA